MSKHYLSIFTQKNMAVLLLLGFSSGLPLALTGGTLQAWMTDAHVDIKTIGLFTLVGQAYVFKFLWAPLMDRFIPPFLGRRRGWLIITQLMLILAIFKLGTLDPQYNLMAMAIIAVFIAFFSASQDIVIDAYRTEILEPEKRGAGAAVSVLGYRIATLVSSGLAIWLAERYLGWQFTYWLMALLMGIGFLASLWAKEPPMTKDIPQTLEQTIVVPLKEFLTRNNAWILLLLIVFYKLSDVFALSLSTTFLMRGVGFTKSEIAEVHKTLGLFATIIGVLVGGSLMQRLSLFKSLMIFGILQAISNLGYWLLSVTEKSLLSLSGVIVFENICGGMATAAFVALLTTLCNRSFSATQYALLSALSAIGRVYAGPFAGWFVELYGWSTFFLFSVFAALPGLLLLFLCRATLEYTQKTNEFSRRTHFTALYNIATRLTLGGGLLLLLWIIVLIIQWLLNIELLLFANFTRNLGGSALTIGIILGAILDYIVIRRNQLTWS